MAQRILVVDDDREIVCRLRPYLEDGGFWALAAYDGEAARQILCADRPVLVVLDMGLPGCNGLDFIRWLRADPLLSANGILILTAWVDSTEKIISLELGADDYLTKPFNPREVLARVRAILRRSPVNTSRPSSVSVDNLRLDIGRRLLSVHGTTVDLTETEATILRLLMENPEQCFTRAELVEKGLGCTYKGGERSLATHIGNLRKKIGVDPTRPSRYLETVFGVGYRFRKREL